MNSCWILVELAINSEWKEKVYKEALQLIDSHTSPNAPSVHLHDRIASVPLTAWEDELPILDACLRETFRIYFNPVAFRRNLHDNVHIGDRLVEKGTFVAYAFGDTHFNKSVYSNPNSLTHRGS